MDTVKGRQNIGSSKLHLCFQSEWKWSLGNFRTCQDQPFNCWQSYVRCVGIPVQANSRMFNPTYENLSKKSTTLFYPLGIVLFTCNTEANPTSKYEFLIQ